MFVRSVAFSPSCDQTDQSQLCPSSPQRVPGVRTNIQTDSVSVDSDWTDTVGSQFFFTVNLIHDDMFDQKCWWQFEQLVNLLTEPITAKVCGKHPEELKETRWSLINQSVIGAEEVELSWSHCPTCCQLGPVKSSLIKLTCVTSIFKKSVSCNDCWVELVTVFAWSHRLLRVWGQMVKVLWSEMTCGYHRTRLCEEPGELVVSK